MSISVGAPEHITSARGFGLGTTGCYDASANNRGIEFPAVTGHPLITLPEWKALESHAKVMREMHMRDLFKNDSDRFSKFSFKLGPLLIDYSKNQITNETLSLLIQLADARGVVAGRESMFKGAILNSTENRAVLHTSLRKSNKNGIYVDGVDIMQEVHAAQDRMKSFAGDIRNGVRKGVTGESFRHIVNIGIGGSHIGPRFVAEALKSTEVSELTVDFVSNLDAVQLDDILKPLDPAKTLFVVCSKTFNTCETISNAEYARKWLVSKLGDEAVALHMAAVSAYTDRALAFGISKEYVFPIWDWVGGRYSLWSAIGLAAIIVRGFEAFERMLAGAEAMDRHFETAPLEQNLPVLLAMIGIWHADFLNTPAIAVLTYDDRLKYFAGHVQQLDMESNGKGVMVDGTPVRTGVGPIVFGGNGSDSQHSFFQFLHQSPRHIACDFIVALSGLGGKDKIRDTLLANVLGQTEALAMGSVTADLSGAPDKLKPHKVFQGNRASNTLLLDEITPYSVGMLVALYEHKVFTQSLIWGVNAFDQWGVELGKELANTIESVLRGGHEALKELGETSNSSTAGLAAAYLVAKGRVQ